MPMQTAICFIYSCFGIILSIVGAQDAALHHYSKTFQGFSARLTPEQAQQLAGTVIRLLWYCLLETQ